MRTVISVSVAFLMLSSLAFHSESISHGTVEQSFFSAHKQEIIAEEAGKGTPYRGSGRLEYN